MNAPGLPQIRLAIFRLEDVCLRLQTGMEAFVRTAGLEKMPGAEATMRWLRRRGVRIALLADGTREQTDVLLTRAGWAIGPEELIDVVLPEQGAREDAIGSVLQLLEETDPKAVIAVTDTPSLLEQARRHGLLFNLSVTNGLTAYRELAAAAPDQLFDSLLQLPEFLLTRLPSAPNMAIVHKLAPAPAPAPEKPNAPPRLTFDRYRDTLATLRPSAPLRDIRW